MKPKAIVYIDGYNWYHAIFKHKPEWKWLNIQAFFESLRPDEEIADIFLFSAMMHESTAKDRQEKYFSVLGTFPKIHITLGMFQIRHVHCGATCKAEYPFYEEKKTDVNIAVQMMSDAIKNNCDRMYVISGDSDTQPVVEWIVKNTKIKVCVYLPALPLDQANRRLDYYRHKGLPVDCNFLPLGNIKDHQLKPAFKMPDGNFICRPSYWGQIPN